jgi:hypothetical protein
MHRSSEPHAYISQRARLVYYIYIQYTVYEQFRLYELLCLVSLLCCRRFPNHLECTDPIPDGLTTTDIEEFT